MQRRSAVQRLWVLGMIMAAPLPAWGACCYFAAKDKDVSQPAQKAFITWNPDEKIETFTVQPKFEGNAEDFGMVIPTPSRPKLNEMPRDFFKELAVFTILQPMDLTKYKRLNALYAASNANGAVAELSRRGVVVLEAGTVGSLDYKIILADRADDLFQWLKDNRYSYAGDQDTLDFYIKKGWTFTVMKIDPKQMKKRADGSYEGNVTPTRFTFTSEKPTYPLKITQISVKDRTEALFYLQAAEKMDLPEPLSYAPAFLTMWSQALSFAIPEKVTAQEAAWRNHVKGELPKMEQEISRQKQNGHEPATLEWAKKLTPRDMGLLTGHTPYDREAPAEDVANLKLLRGHLKQGQFITKIRKVFSRDEMADDLVFTRARVAGQDDDIEYVSILPTSPP